MTDPLPDLMHRQSKSAVSHEVFSLSLTHIRPCCSPAVNPNAPVTPFYRQYTLSYKREGELIRKKFAVYTRKYTGI